MNLDLWINKKKHHWNRFLYEYIVLLITYLRNERKYMYKYIYLSIYSYNCWRLRQKQREKQINQYEFPLSLTVR
jgi:hypothetical protein